MRDFDYQPTLPWPAAKPVRLLPPPLPGSAPLIAEKGSRTPAKAAFDENFGISLFGRTYYINIRIGSEHRSQIRRLSDGQIRVSGIAFLYTVICSAAIMLFGTLCLIYLLKSGLGINLASEPSALHPLYAIMSGR